MKMPGECLDMNVGTRKTSEIQSEKTSESQATTSKGVSHFLEVTTDAELLEELKKINDNEKARKEEDRSERPKIQSVRPYLRQGSIEITKNFLPRDISVGPLHAGKPKLCKKQLKFKLAKKFIEGGGEEPAQILAEINTNIVELKTCFSKIPDRCNDDFLARLLFLDGCAVLQFIRSYVEDELKDFQINTTQAAIIQQDLFLFENQIPFEVLTLLMVRAKRSEYADSIIQFVHENNICATNNAFNYGPKRSWGQMIRILDTIKPVHLLDLLRKVSIFGCIENVAHEIHQRRELIGHRSFRSDQELIRQRSLRSVQELKSSGITMKLCNSRSLKSATFATHCLGIFGHLKLPALNVNNSTVRKLWNLVAYETCLDDNEIRLYSVTSYLNFLDLLIDTEQDVKDLRRAHILRNALGSDAEVARFFNTLGLPYLSKSDEDHFESIHSKIEEHYGKKCRIKMAQIYNSYIRNPWPTLGFFLAPAALLLTVVQTWYAINPGGESYRSWADLSWAKFQSF